ncbi:hypothetical protein SLA2020_148330 [Shorea laevis]
MIIGKLISAMKFEQQRWAGPAGDSSPNSSGRPVNQYNIPSDPLITGFVRPQRASQNEFCPPPEESSGEPLQSISLSDSLTSVSQAE